MKAPSFFERYSKYKGILVSIILFIILDVSVMVMNFYISFQIADDAVGVNLAGRQRMLSQRTMKSLFDVQASVGNPTELQRATDELTATTGLFHSTLIAFDQGGAAKGASGEDVILAAAASAASKQSIAVTKDIWTPYYAKITDLLTAQKSGDQALLTSSLAAAIAAGKASNLAILKEMNNLTVDLEQVAASKANTLRWVQMIGITLALINFFIIIFHSFKNLRESDAKIEAARQETQEILATVNEGLFLVDKDLVIGKQHSTELTKIFNRDDIAGQHFEALLRSLVSEKDMATAQSYIKLLFKKTVNQNLIGDLNPLNEVEIHLPTGDGTYDSKFLSFAFSRVHTDKTISHVLVTVADISERVRLTRELEATKGQSEQQLEMLTTLLNSNSDMIPEFLDNSFKTFNLINQVLRMPAKNQSAYVDKATRIFALIHNFKGEASALSLNHFVDKAHEFEDQLDKLRAKRDLTGNDFLSLTISLNEMISYAETARKMVGKLASLTVPTSHGSNVVQFKRKDWGHLQDLANSVARRQGKMVEVVASGLNDHDLPDAFSQVINSISVQFIRNAVTHGIEPAKERLMAQKPEKGEINIRLTRRDNGALQYMFEDDGSGLDIDGIRNKALKVGLINEIEAESMDRKQVMSLIFAPELSTRDIADEDAGRGIGMSAIKESLNQLGGKITIANRAGYGCKFTVTFPPKQAFTALTA